VESYVWSLWSVQGYAKAIVGKGDTTMFWNDIWNFGFLQQLYPHLFSFAREPNCSVIRFLSLLLDYGRLFQLTLSMIASHHLAELMDSWGMKLGRKWEWYMNLYLGGRHLYIKTGLSEHHWTYTSISSLSLLWHQLPFIVMEVTLSRKT
jgi:hypothetical protein